MTSKSSSGVTNVGKNYKDEFLILLQNVTLQKSRALPSATAAAWRSLSS